MSGKAHHKDQETWVQKSSDGKKIEFLPLGLSIVWGNDKRYWRLPEAEKIKIETERQKEKPTPAELIQVCWLEVTGKANIDPGKNFKISFDFSLKSDAFGWSGCQVYLMAKVGAKGQYAWKKVNLKNPVDATNMLDFNTKNGKDRDKDDSTLYFGLYEIWSGKWKGGLLIHKVVVEIY